MTAYNTMDAGVAGQLQGLDPCQIDSKVASGAITFGATVWQTSGNETVVTAFDGVKTIFAGVALFSQKEPGGYADKDTVNVIRQGQVLVPVTGNVSAGAQAYVDATTGIFKATGKAIANARFVTNNSNGLAIVQLNGAADITLP